MGNALRPFDRLRDHSAQDKAVGLINYMALLVEITTTCTVTKDNISS